MRCKNCRWHTCPAIQTPLLPSAESDIAAATDMLGANFWQGKCRVGKALRDL
jgi:hypothetical protein